MQVEVGNARSANFKSGEYCGVMIQYPNTKGEVHDWTDFSKKCHDEDMLVVGCTDILASTILKPVGEMGIDIAVGSAQRFGVPMVYTSINIINLCIHSILFSF
jgi:glycine dehydrogenase